MTTVIPQLDKSLDTVLSEGHGTITIRVVVLAKGMAAAPAAVDETPADAQADEVLPETDKRPVSGFLEEPKRGRQCCVFLINGQRQHFWDNQFIVRDLELKYLRNRMIVVVDCDALKPEAVAELMRGDRSFDDGQIGMALKATIVPQLKLDQDLVRIHDTIERSLAELPRASPEVFEMFHSLIRSD